MKAQSRSSAWLERYTDNVEVRSSSLRGTTLLETHNGGLAHLARAPALQAGGNRFDSDILHKITNRHSTVEPKAFRMLNVL